MKTNENYFTDEELLEYLSKGFTQQEISDELKRLGYFPNSLSMIEKMLKRIKKEHNANTLYHLAVILNKK
ncbi:hypothetical protein [Flavobacterium phage V157]|uniref:Uncharacterized protein n=12 Tax=Ficleduovirus FCV1 TaxID=2560474 RepID=A0A218M8F2_9CAUD|nr:hypothetical protein FDG55_gp66 [Flavobacterium phage FCV-1]ASD51648.1 hypothetical protein [Flavobacterium phage FCV-3]ASD51722.1 hypothetical protein [Flavobacterium phage FCV-11]ASD51797.1 hypothetical protein [Flavobacterium phage V175]ASD51875.1 hypothetical protein [Flavobacterium phage V181]ASD52552.1 hypothetical protein [Flavobacterium phage FCV-10]ASD52625.1 hypothetical protein [Flavobacterium phage FCV-16]ASD52699.1 hypothetical protein [Flavobacterium phage FCV-20]ASD52773.1